MHMLVISTSNNSVSSGLLNLESDGGKYTTPKVKSSSACRNDLLNLNHKICSESDSIKCTNGKIFSFIKTPMPPLMRRYFYILHCDKNLYLGRLIISLLSIFVSVTQDKS